MITSGTIINPSEEQIEKYSKRKTAKIELLLPPGSQGGIDLRVLAGIHPLYSYWIKGRIDVLERSARVIVAGEGVSNSRMPDDSTTIEWHRSRRFPKRGAEGLFFRINEHERSTGCHIYLEPVYNWRECCRI
jgi:hypothetical protein